MGAVQVVVARFLDLLAVLMADPVSSSWALGAEGGPPAGIRGAGLSRGLELEGVQWLWLCSLSLPSLAGAWAGELHRGHPGVTPVPGRM